MNNSEFSEMMAFYSAAILVAVFSYLLVGMFVELTCN